MYGKFGNANAEYDLSLAFEWFWEVSCNFGVTIGYVRLIKIKFIRTILHRWGHTDASDLFYFYACASKLMHLPKEVISLLMRLAYYNRLPFDYVLETRSLPARSTIFSIPLRYFVSPLSVHLWRTVIWMTAWLRDDRLFFVRDGVLRRSTRSFLFLLPCAQSRRVLLLCARKLRRDLGCGCPTRCSTWFLVSYRCLRADRRCNRGRTRRSWLLLQIVVRWVSSWSHWKHPQLQDWNSPSTTSLRQRQCAFCRSLSARRRERWHYVPKRQLLRGGCSVSRHLFVRLGSWRDWTWIFFPSYFSSGYWWRWDRPGR